MALDAGIHQKCNFGPRLDNKEVNERRFTPRPIFTLPLFRRVYVRPIVPATHSERDQLFKPGSIAPRTGMYNAIHHPGHRPMHAIVLKHGEKFPVCKKCEYTVFLLVAVAPHFSEDEDFQ